MNTPISHERLSRISSLKAHIDNTTIKPNSEAAWAAPAIMVLPESVAIALNTLAITSPLPG